MINVITLNYNQNDFTIKCVESILKSNFDKFWLTIVDNGSTDINYLELKNKLPKHSRIKFHRLSPNRGYVGGINYALKVSEPLNASHNLILNNDTLIDQNAIGDLYQTCLAYNNKAIVTGKVYHYDEPNKFQDVGYSYSQEGTLEYKRIGLNEIDLGQFDEIEERDMIDDIFWLFPKSLYEEIGGYSNYFWFNAEQVDFALKAKKIGYKLIFSPNSKLLHKGSVSIGGRDRNPKLAFYHIQSSLILKYLHLNKLNFTKFLLKSLNSTIRTSLKSSISSLKGDKSWKNYAKAKRMGTLYFVKWIFLKNDNDGYNPF